MIEFSHILYEIVIWLFLLYSILIFLIYTWIGLYAFGALKKYRSQNQFTDYNLIATNPNTPSFSIIAPAYNEGVTIVDNVRSLLSLYYPNLEIIIVNDGSADDSIDKLIRAYDLELVHYHIQEVLPTNKVRGVYKSKNRAFQRLVVVDKVNGGKADALNVGINISTGQYIVCIDVDCILEQDALLKLAKPFLDQTEKRVIACGGVIRLANNCRVENGKVVDINLPKSWLGRFQALEYIRAFVLGRMAWSRASGLILISGAFGAFDKEIVLACGGYDSNTVGEDMELVVRMRRYMEDKKLKYNVINIPDPLCWTEVPESKEILKKQRNRWMRGTIETLWKHRKLMFNPKYGKLGMISIPYWFFFEFLGPIIEFSGYCVFILFFSLGIINWPFFIVLLALVLAFGILYSVYAILIDLHTDQVYTKKKDLKTLLFAAIMEPFLFHATVVKAGVSGFRDYRRKQNSWGEMTRTGFQQVARNESAFKRVSTFVSRGLRAYLPLSIVFLLLFMLSTGVELWWYVNHLNQPLKTVNILYLLLDNSTFSLQAISIIGVIFLILHSWSTFLSKRIAISILTFIFSVNFVLFLYFSESNNLLGADLFYYNKDEVLHILQTSGVLKITNIALLLLVVLIGLIPMSLASRYAFKNVNLAIGLLMLTLVSTFVPVQKIIQMERTDAFSQSASVSKWGYFFNSNLSNYLQNHPILSKYSSDNYASTLDQEITEYPFFRKEETTDMLGLYLSKSEKTPNLVILIIEGLGHAYSSPNGYIGNFTPFIDSLKNKSLYWDNNLSSSGRTFSVLPTVLGSLPFAKNGFLELEEYPLHFNLWNILQKNNFKTGFFYGGDARFDFMSKYAKNNNINVLIDIESYDNSYRKLPAGQGESWGYEDQAVLNNMLHLTTMGDQPYFNVLLTLSTHSPFLINNSAYYEKLVKEQIDKLMLTGEKKKTAIQYTKQLASVMNLDDALREFFEKYKKRPDFNSTIFIITGDHSMPEIALQSKIDRYHVPLLIYSPLINKPTTFRNTVSHFDIAPSILAYYKYNHNLIIPENITWIGKGLKEGASKSSYGVPIMQSKYQLEDYVFLNYHLSNGKLFKLDHKLEEDIYFNKEIESEIKARFDLFHKKNKVFISQNKLLPDSAYYNFFNY